MQIENYIIEALSTVSTRDLPDEDLADAIADQAMLLAGISYEDIAETQPDCH